MDGIFLVNKPRGVTSRDICNKFMHKFHYKKVGHVGTLDPFATGLLIIVAGKSTKAAQFIEKKDKYYIATLRLGEKTDTLDSDGKIIQKMPIPELDKKKVSKILHTFVGKLDQMPPMYSAIKYQGTPLYKLARSNINIERKMRTIEIFSVRLNKVKDNEIHFSVKCSKGTYIRTLGEQLAEKLGTVGHLVSLKRTKVGNFDLKNAKSLKNIQEKDALNVREALTNIEQIKVDNVTAKNVKDGKTLSLEKHNNLVLIIDENDNPLAIYSRAFDSTYKCVRGLF